jgi:dTDP-4-amino-4,6-dideoxygalactose transaminase
MRMFFDHGRQSKYWHEFEGINSRLDTIKAALLRKCLPLLGQWNHERRQAALLYDKTLAGIGEVSLPCVLDGTDPVYHLYVILVPDRDALQRHLGAKGIGTGIHYPYSLNQLPAYAHLNQTSGAFPNAEYACTHMLSLPMFPGITGQEMASVCSEIKAFYGK